MNTITEISVVMSVYNTDKYLDESIKSILAQTYENFEFILINDGSTDASLEIIEKYAHKDKRIILISRENRGLIASLNEGIKLARGEYIARMDADDISLPTRFEEQLAFMKRNEGIGVCGTAVIGFGENIKRSIWRLSTNDSSLKTELLFSSIFAHPSVIFKKSLFTQYNLSYESEFKHAEDFRLWTKMAEFTRFANLKKPLLKYRILENSVTREADKNREDRYHVIKSIFSKYLSKLEIENSEEENRLHFNLTLNDRIQDSHIEFKKLREYFNKLLEANNNKNVFNKAELKKVLGKKWLWNLYYKRELKGVFSIYFFYGLWSIVSK